jgi:hypothetical protein
MLDIQAKIFCSLPSYRHARCPTDGDTRVYRVVVDEARPDTGELEHDLT